MTITTGAHWATALEIESGKKVKIGEDGRSYVLIVGTEKVGPDEWTARLKWNLAKGKQSRDIQCLN